MTWGTADEVCPVEFKGSGYRHLAADIFEGPFNLFNVNNYEEDESVAIQKYCPESSIVNITSPYMVERLRRDLARFAAGEEFIIRNVNFRGYNDFKCEMVRKLGHEFRRMFRRCNEFYRALCEHCEYNA
uniref:Uncharacterized protein n=1 Tax=Magallana gigas TaxID=29159 RepID=K1RMX1_MAGGI